MKSNIDYFDPYSYIFFVITYNLITQHLSTIFMISLIP